MKKLLIVIDMQNDFIDGAFGSKEAQQIVPKVVNKINSWDGDIAYTLDTHFDNYSETYEGCYLPVHCIYATNGYYLTPDVASAFREKTKEIKPFHKSTFSSIELALWIWGLRYDYIEIVGLCTDICVISNAMLIKAYNPEAEIVVVADCCAGSTKEKHEAALSVMQSCLITII